MITRICLCLVLFAAIPAMSQVAPGATGPPADDQMRTPPPVSGEAYPTATGSETRSNYLGAGLSVNTAYNDNVFTGGSTKPTGDEVYAIASSFSLDQTTSRTHRTFTYSPGFTFYEHTNALNAMNQNATVGFQYRLSPHLMFSLRDSFVQSSNVFDQPYGGISGSTQSPTESVVAPFASQRNDAASGIVSYQFAGNAMIGGGGTFAINNYTNSAQTTGLSNSKSGGGSAFYNRRLSAAQYIGVTYQYSNMRANSMNEQSKTETQTINSFYSVYLKHILSLSVSGGPQHVNDAESTLAASDSWKPSITASVGWQTSRVSCAVSYSRTVSGAGGLLGTFKSTSAGASARWQLARTWTVGSTFSYTNNTSVNPLSVSASQGGRTLSGTVLLQRALGEHFAAEAGYSRLNQSYPDISSISAAPNIDREYISVSYKLRRPLGR
jgi:hypothetical protein